MKKLIVMLILMILCAIPITAMAGNDIHEGAFGATLFGVTQFNGETAMVSGFRAGWILEKSLVLEGVFCGLVSEIDSPRKSYDLGIGYSGLSLGYILLPDKPVYFSVNTLMGLGRVGDARDYDEQYNKDEEKSVSRFVFVEPGAMLEFRILDSLRIALNVSYRYIDDVRFEGLEDSDLSGITGMITIKVGSF